MVKYKFYKLKRHAYANDFVRDIHPRMPVVLTPEMINTWIMEPIACRELLKKIPPQLLATAEDNQISLW